MCSRSEAGSYSRLMDVVYHSTLSVGVIKKRGERGVGPHLLGRHLPGEGGELLAELAVQLVELPVPAINCFLLKTAHAPQEVVSFKTLTVLYVPPVVPGVNY